MNTWKMIQKQYDTNRQFERKRIEQEVRASQKLDSIYTTNAVTDNSKVASWNSTMVNLEPQFKPIY